MPSIARNIMQIVILHTPVGWAVGFGVAAGRVCCGVILVFIWSETKMSVRGGILTGLTGGCSLHTAQMAAHLCVYSCAGCCWALLPVLTFCSAFWTKTNAYPSSDVQKSEISHDSFSQPTSECPYLGTATGMRLLYLSAGIGAAASVRPVCPVPRLPANHFLALDGCR